MDLLNMFATNHLTAEEYAQLRLFSTKLQAIPAQIMAGRLFKVDLELIAPVSPLKVYMCFLGFILVISLQLMGSVVTYLLVALQFQWPSKLEGIIAIPRGNESQSNGTLIKF